jgi:hypothetical protein
MLSFTNQNPEEINEQIKNGVIKDKVAGALALAWSQIRQFANVCVVSGGIDKETAKKLGFFHYENVGEALTAAFFRHGSSAMVTVLPAGGDILPLNSEEENI